VLSLPMPAPLFFDGIRLPASYANFYIGNEAVIVPTFNDPNDPPALEMLAGLFPTRAWSASTPSIWCGASARSTA
jgi:agmatine deiminase